MKLSNQALGALMMTLQKCLLEETDIVELLQETDWELDEAGELIVVNPPIVSFEGTTVNSVNAFVDEVLTEEN